ncbi:FAD-binding oxidoreductase [Robiginitomaculum antarcticum]|uniref:FAD-binding oxidoreductase n=1 Tax=Robiginitomaculum antarcticum TaxID=437507 RepID=UPI000374EBBD|nr:FAD-binding oxidoreductase [Robiginitomaculum antarcticum]
MNTAGLDALKTRLPAQIWTDDATQIAPWLSEWRDKFHGTSPLMLMPRSTEDVAQAVKICAEYKLPLLPQGGNTGLVGGSTPQGEVLLSLRKLNALRSVSAADQLLIVEAGMTLQAVQEVATKAGMMFPLSLAAEGSCTIGGNLSTNAGGVHVIKYGSAKSLCLGVEAVMADGSVYSDLSRLRKDNTGYDLSRLFLGAEGTLGIITAASLRMVPAPAGLMRALVALDGPDAALDLLGRVQDRALTLFEVMPRSAIELVLKYIPDQRDPFSEAHPYYVLIDWELRNHDAAAREPFTDMLSRALEAGIIRDVVISQNETQADQLLALREHMSAAQKHDGGSIKHDISVAVSDVPAFFSRADALMAQMIPGCRPVGFGHMGDGNIHYNVARPEDMAPQDFLAQWDWVQTAVHDLVTDMGGSISAEHGIGIMKKDDLAARADPVKIALMKTLKASLDPDRIMNPRIMI